MSLFFNKKDALKTENVFYSRGGTWLPVANVVFAPSSPPSLPAGRLHAAFSAVAAVASDQVLIVCPKSVGHKKTLSKAERVSYSRGGTCLSVADVVSAPYRPPALAAAAVLGGSSAVAALAPFQVPVVSPKFWT